MQGRDVFDCGNKSLPGRLRLNDMSPQAVMACRSLPLGHQTSLEGWTGDSAQKKAHYS